MDSLASLAGCCLIPGHMYASAWLICLLCSILLGSAFSSAAAAGVVMFHAGLTSGADPAILAGAILSGCYVGDRWSSLSSSAMLVAEQTGTSFRNNLISMARTAIGPLVMCSVLYWILGGPTAPAASFQIRNLISAVPVLSLLVLSLLKCPLYTTIGISLLLSVLQGFASGVDPGRLLASFVFGTPSGGGMKSMVFVVCVVCLSSLYTGFFEQTAILRRVKQLHIPPILCALLTCSLACSQTLALVLSAQLLSGKYRNREELAMTLEDTVVPMAALIP
ncbi:hypothetical protein [uncultured Faecalibaculum sp.]|uniref:hypothetical protein n=1 Tax=uncultured Faecalibaculum sp. TaxID=1729681 RepID=UPI002606EE87|nr:hypothetical protein [uncultured Faecalibaculum sp.]